MAASFSVYGNILKADSTEKFAENYKESTQTVTANWIRNVWNEQTRQIFISFLTSIKSEAVPGLKDIVDEDLMKSTERLVSNPL